MRGKLDREGHYVLFETTKGHQILTLNNKAWFAVVKGQYGDILIKSDSDHEKAKTIKEGKFYLASFNDDPEFSDIPHLFLEEGSKFREWILPNNAPTEEDYQKKLIKTGNLVAKDKINFHVHGSGDIGREKQHKGTRYHASSRKAEKRSVSRRKNRLKEKTKKELYSEAKNRNIEGRSKMNKEELVNALTK